MSEQLKTVKLPEEMRFRGKWRSYQKRVLQELEKHLSDKKLNVVAAPGAGKTTLGIEVVCRLGRPALILAPTITIKNQWEKRIFESFLPLDYPNDFVSTDISEIKTITSSTYQAIHSLLTDNAKTKVLISELNKNGVKTIVLDEAHHLRTEWYKSLIKLCSELSASDFTIVSLTATPPYDVTPSEWENYHKLCGPVDSEISIPELVKNGDLCPHQDLIYFCNLDDEELQTVNSYRENINSFLEELKKNSEFAYTIESSDFLNDLEKNLELIYEDTSFTISLISYLLYEDAMHEKAYVLTELLDVPIEKIPKFDNKIAETLFNGILGNFESHFQKIAGIKRRLKDLNLLYTSKKVDFTGRVNLNKLFCRSKSKLRAIEDITMQEFKNLTKDLREVILLDYIGKGDSFGLNVLSIFKLLKNQNLPVGILTGTLVVVPKTAKEKLYEIAAKYGITSKQLLTAEFEDDYLRVEGYGNVDVTQIVTELYAQGGVNILAGTQALLGEGWDSPCTNCLIIASTIGSFMSSNQMRGRALRIDKNNKSKTANIWHLAACNDCLQGSDIGTLVRRFSTFEGISYIDNTIKNGIERLGVKFERSDIKRLNNLMKTRSSERASLADKWTQVFKQSEITEQKMTSGMCEIIQAEQTRVPAVYKQVPTRFFENFFYKKIFNKYFNILYQESFALGNSLLVTLKHFGIITTRSASVKIIVEDNLSSITTTIIDCSNYERNVFIKCYNELFTFSENARYIIKKQSDFCGCIDKEKRFFKIYNFFFSNRKNEYELPTSILEKDSYYFVPEVLGRKQDMVNYFVYSLYSNFGYFDVVYTRNPNGRKELMKAKLNFSNNNLKQLKIWM